jgi:uncharacterized membrane protein
VNLEVVVDEPPGVLRWTSNAEEHFRSCEQFDRLFQAQVLTPKIRALRLGARVLGIGLFAVVGLSAAMALNQMYPGIPWFGVVLLGYAVFCVLNRYASGLTRARIIRASGPGGECVARIGADGFHLETVASSSFLQWRAFDQLIETPQFIFLQLATSAIALPTRALNEKLIREMRNYVGAAPRAGVLDAGVP